MRMKYKFILFIGLLSLFVFFLYSLDTTIYAAEQIPQRSEKFLKGAEFAKNVKVVSLDGLYRVYEFFAIGHFKMKKEDFNDTVFLELLQKYPYTDIFPNAKISRTFFVNGQAKNVLMNQEELVSYLKGELLRKSQIKAFFRKG